MRGRVPWLLLLLAVATPTLAPALEWWAGAGVIGVTSRDRSATVAEAEVRFEPVALGVFPLIGGLATSEEAISARVGLGRRWRFGDRWEAVVTTAACAYEPGEGKDLGSAIQFRSALDVSFRWRQDVAVGLSVAHLSNGGLAEDNPGIEMVIATLSWRP